MSPLKTIAVPVKSRRAAQDAPAVHVATKVASVPAVPGSAARPTHRYAVGERLQVAGGGRVTSRAAGPATVVARLPHEGGPLLYRVKVEAEGHERIVAEVDLTPL